MSECTSNNIKEHCVYIKDRAQKITEALYRVTDLFPEEEPLKWLLRKEGVEILNSLIVLENASPHARIKGIESASRMIPHILCILELASSGTLISNINFEVLRREYSGLHDFIQSKGDQLTSSSIGLLSDGKHAVDPAFLANNVLKKNNETSSDNFDAAKTGHIDKGQTDNRQVSTIKDKTDNNQKDKNSNLKPMLKTESGIIKKFVVNNSEDKLNRQKKILSFIKDNDWVRVGDVAAIFETNISEKTIQRDLLSMVDSGILRKAGDKRWRRYALM